MAFHIESQVFDDGTSIPSEFSREGNDESPPLRWADVPSRTKELALVCEDPDAPQAEPFVHWVAYKIPGNFTELPQDIPKLDVVETPVQMRQGKNSYGEVGYGGPMPPKGHGTHRYRFRLLALDEELDLEPGADKAELMKKIEDHVLGETVLVGTYERH